VPTRYCCLRIVHCCRSAPIQFVKCACNLRRIIFAAMWYGMLSLCCKISLVISFLWYMRLTDIQFNLCVDDCCVDDAMRCCRSYTSCEYDICCEFFCMANMLYPCRDCERDGHDWGGVIVTRSLLCVVARTWIPSESIAMMMIVCCSMIIMIVVVLLLFVVLMLSTMLLLLLLLLLVLLFLYVSVVVFVVCCCWRSCWCWCWRWCP